MSKWIGMTIAPAVTGRSLLESPSTEVRGLEGRPLGLSSSLMLPESSRLRLLELGSSFVTALAEQQQPMTGLMSFASRAGWPAGQWLQPNFACGSASPRER